MGKHGHKRDTVQKQSGGREGDEPQAKKKRSGRRGSLSEKYMDTKREALCRACRSQAGKTNWANNRKTETEGQRRRRGEMESGVYEGFELFRRGQLGQKGIN